MVVIGEAAGVAAALAVRTHTTPRQVDLSLLQDLLRAQGAISARIAIRSRLKTWPGPFPAG